MRNIIKTVAATMVLAVGLVMGGCRHRTVSQSGASMAWDSICVDTTFTLSETADSPACHLSLHLRVAVGERSQQVNDSLLRSGLLPTDYLSLSTEKLTARQMVDSFVKRYGEDYQAFYRLLYREEPGEPSANISIEVMTQTRVGWRGRYVNYVAQRRQRRGLGGGMVETCESQVRNIDAETGRLVRLNDIFVPGHEARLCQAIATQLCRQTATADTIKLKEKGYFVATDVYATENFELGQEGITFIYVQGEIADRQAGEVNVTIGYDDLNGIMKKLE